MKYLALDEFYHQIRKWLTLTVAYTEISDLAFIIKACRLKPYDYLLTHKVEPKIHRKWVDEHHNSLLVGKKKQVSLVLNDLDIKIGLTFCTDLYAGLSLPKVAKISKLAYLFVGKDDTLNQDCYLVSMLGIDNYFRTYLYLYGEWSEFPSLHLGLKILKIIADHKYFKRSVKLNNKFPIPGCLGNTWITGLPITAKLKETIKDHEPLQFLRGMN